MSGYSLVLRPLRHAPITVTDHFQLEVADSQPG